MVAAKRFPGCISYYLTLSDTDFVELQKHYESGGGGGGGFGPSILTFILEKLWCCDVQTWSVVSPAVVEFIKIFKRGQ